MLGGHRQTLPARILIESQFIPIASVELEEGCRSWTKKVNQLENSLLELGTEMFRLKHRLLESHHQQEQILKGLQAFKELLHEKNLISEEEFECAADLIRLNGKARQNA